MFLCFCQAYLNICSVMSVKFDCVNTGHHHHILCTEVDGSTRLGDGSAGPGYEYGRLEIFERGFWSNVCNNDRFTPDSAHVACRALGYDGGASLRFTQAYADSLSQVRHLSPGTHSVSYIVMHAGGTAYWTCLDMHIHAVNHHTRGKSCVSHSQTSSDTCKPSRRLSWSFD